MAKRYLLLCFRFTQIIVKKIRPWWKYVAEQSVSKYVAEQ